MRFHLRRLAGYALGFILFYAPFALAQTIIFYLFTGRWEAQTVHDLCFRIQIEHLLDGKVYSLPAPFAACAFLLLALTFIFGPVFCGRLCPAGAFTEYLSRLMPEKWQISWSSYADIAPIRYGMLAGFVILPLFNGILACSYCNFFVFDLFVNYFLFGYFISLSSTLLLTLALWLGLFGLFTRGGRGYCNFLCPVGAMQNVIYYLARNFKFTYKLLVDKNKCVGCGECQKSCPMEAMDMADGKARANIHNCILCGVCIEKCPVKAIRYGRGTNEK